MSNLIEKINRWNGRLDTALVLRRQLQEMPVSKQKGRTEAEQALFALRSCYEKTDGVKRVLAMLDDPEKAAVAAPFIGDPQLGAWPFSDPLAIDDEAAEQWAPLLGKYAATDDKEILRFVEVMLRVRRRPVWLAAAQAFAHLAMRDPAVFEKLQQEWSACFPEGLPKRWDSSLAGSKPSDCEAHRRRHALYMACCRGALGGDSAKLKNGPAPDILAAMPLPAKDEADASIVLESLLTLLRGTDTRALVLPHLPKRIHESHAEPQSDDTLRDMADLLRSDPASESVGLAIEKRLCEPRWQECKEMRRLDALWSWSQTAEWLASRNKQKMVTDMATAAPEADFLLRMKTGEQLPEGMPSAVDATLERLRVVVNRDIRLTTPENDIILIYVELLALLERPEIRDLPWDCLKRRALGIAAVPDLNVGNKEEPRLVKDVAHAELTMLLDPNETGCKAMLHDRALPKETVLKMVGSSNNFVMSQAAIQTERLLRERDDTTPAGTNQNESDSQKHAEKQIRLLWAVLQKDPKRHYFDELLSMLRGEPDEQTPLHEVVSAINSLDEFRDNEAPMKEVANGYEQLAKQVKHLAPVVGERIDALASALRRVSELKSDDVGNEEWREALQEMILGRDKSTGLDDWMDYLQMPMAGIKQAWEAFRAVMERIAEAEWKVSSADFEELAESMFPLKGNLKSVPWPERIVLDKTFDALEKRINEQRSKARERSRLTEKVEKIIKSGDEATALEMSKSENDINDMSADALKKLHSFLLERFLFRDAKRLRLKITETRQIRLPGLFGYLAPLISGVFAGALLLLDMGMEWNELIQSGAYGATLITAILSLVLSFLLSSRLLIQGLPGRFDIYRRIFGVYMICFACAALSTTAILLILRGTSVSIEITNPLGEVFLLQIFLWTSLSLLYGLFIGILLQGASLTRD